MRQDLHLPKEDKMTWVCEDDQDLLPSMNDYVVNLGKKKNKKKNLSWLSRGEAQRKITAVPEHRCSLYAALVTHEP